MGATKLFLPIAAGLIGLALLCGRSQAATAFYTPASTVVNGRTVTIWSKPKDDSGAMRIVADTHNTLWFGERTLGTLVRFRLTGRANAYAVPIEDASVHALTAQPDGRVWFADYQSEDIGRVQAKRSRAKFTLFETPNWPGGTQEMANGADGAIWFTTSTNGIGRISYAGDTSYFALADNSTLPSAITNGPDGEIWFSEWQGPNIGYVDAGGAVHEFPAGFGPASNSLGIAYGSDGRIWFTDPANFRIGAMRTDGTHLHSYKGFSGMPSALTAGPDGNLYFGEFQGTVGMITPAGAISEYPLPKSEGSFPVLGITTGPDGNIWFTNYEHAQIGELAIH